MVTTILKGLKKMKFLSGLTKYQILLIQKMLMSEEWKIYKEYVKNLVFDYLNSVENKDFLKGIKFSVTKFEEDIERV